MTTNTAQLYLIRGLPGSGKSTLAVHLLASLHARWFEADMWMRDDNGNYLFDASKLARAHEGCHARAETGLRDGMAVVVSNTFTRVSELLPYFRLAKELGCPEPVVIEVHGQFGSIHNVPDDVMLSMKARWWPFDIDEIRRILDQERNNGCEHKHMTR